MRADIVVIGSGLTALIAARTVQQAGRRPLLIWPGLSSLYFVFATIDVLGYPDPSSQVPVENPGRAVEELIAADQAHPYARAGLEALRRGLTMMLEWLKAAGLSWQGRLDHNYLLPTAIGGVKPGCLVPDSMAAGELRTRTPIILCGFEGYDDFAPELAAASLSEGKQRDAAAITAMRVPLPGFEPGRLFSSIDLARAFEDERFRGEVGDRIRKALPRGECRLGLAAVLGMTHHAEAHRRLQEALEVPVFEIPTVPPSIPGLRLFDRLRKQLQETGVEILWNAPAHAAEVADGRCKSISVKSAGREQRIEASSFLLALEDAVDGAWLADVHRVRDPFLQLTLAEHEIPAHRAAPSLFSPQPFASIGYRVNGRLQPLNESGSPVADNLFVAGGAIAGYDPTGTKSRGGLAIATGYRAAMEALTA